MCHLRSSRNLLTSSSNTDDSADTPALVASLKSRTHNVNITCTVKGVVKAAVGDLNQVILNASTLGKLGGVDEFCGTEFPCPLLLVGVGVNGDDAGGFDKCGGSDDSETDGTDTKDSDGRALCGITA